MSDFVTIFELIDAAIVSMIVIVIFRWITFDGTN